MCATSEWNDHQGAEEVETEEMRAPYMLVHVLVKYDFEQLTQADHALVVKCDVSL